jgi:hypothetical protein
LSSSLLFCNAQVSHSQPAGAAFQTDVDDAADVAFASVSVAAAAAPNDANDDDVDDFASVAAAVAEPPNVNGEDAVAVLAGAEPNVNVDVGDKDDAEPNVSADIVEVEVEVDDGAPNVKVGFAAALSLLSTLSIAPLVSDFSPPGRSVSHAAHLSSPFLFCNAQVAHSQPVGTAHNDAGAATATVVVPAAVVVVLGLSVSQAAHFVSSSLFCNAHVSHSQPVGAALQSEGDFTTAVAVDVVVVVACVAIMAAPNAEAVTGCVFCAAPPLR